MLIFKKTIASILSLLICVLFLYVITDVGYWTYPMITTGIPYNIGSVIFCIFIPIFVFIGAFEEYEESNIKIIYN